MFDGLGEEKTKNTHIHFSKIMYGAKGEIKHLTFADDVYGPEFEPLAEIIIKNKEGKIPIFSIKNKNEKLLFSSISFEIFMLSIVSISCSVPVSSSFAKAVLLLLKTNKKVNDSNKIVILCHGLKADKTEIPDVSEFITRTVQDLENYYLKQETYTKEEIENLIGQIKTAHFEVVESLPEIGQENIIYLVRKPDEEFDDIYVEYIWVNNAYELIGSTKVDLSGYLTKTEYNDSKYSYVKDGIVNNGITLTDEEKLHVETWLGLPDNYLTYYNSTPYKVEDDYNPAHKKYVDEKDSLLREKISEIELSKFPNATIIGAPTIQQGQVSGFSLTDYLEFPFLVDFKGNPFEINFAFTTGQDVDNQQNILDSDFGLAFAIRNKHLVMALSFNGTSWATEQVGSLVLQPQITYRIRISWNRLLYKVQYSMDGGNTYVDDITFGATQSPYPRQMYIGTGKLAKNYFKGIINLNYADVSISGNKIWLGMDDAGLATRLAIDLSNIDSAGIQKVKEIASVDLTNYLNKNDTGTSILKGKIQIGDYTSNITNALLHIRKVSSSITGKSVNGACYSVNSDGTASLQHKIYNDDGSGAKNSAVLRMSNQGIQFAINTGSGATPSEDMYKELATQEYVDGKIGNIDTLLASLDTGSGV